MKLRETQAGRAAAAEAMRDFADGMFDIPDEWGPCWYDEELEVVEIPVVMYFSHWVEHSEDGQPIYKRTFSCVRDYCEQPFANKKNEELFRREENDGKFRDWKTSDLRNDETMPTKQKTNESWY